MHISKEHILELQIIIKEAYGRDIDFSQASLIANDMVGYFDLLAKLNHQNNEYKESISI
jgi:hypothetical protein